MEKRGGFSLLEIIVVLSLIGIVLGAFLFRMGGFTDLTRSETARGDLRAIQKAIQSYYLNIVNYRSNGNQYTYPATANWQTTLINDNPRVLRQKLYDPFRAANTEYSYALSNNGKYYVAFSYGPNRIADISTISDTGSLTIIAGHTNDDIYVTNGS